MTSASSKPAILAMFAPRSALKRRLEESYSIVGPYSHPLLALRDNEYARHIRAAMTIGRLGFSRQLMEALPQLGIICAYGAGYENIDLAAAAERGIRVTNGRGANASCVADTALALLLSVVLKVVPADQYVRSGVWNAIPPRNWTAQPGFGGKRMGIFGLGEIGLRIAQRAAAFELEVAYCNRSPRRDVSYRYFPDARSLAEWCDYLVIAAPASEASRAIIDAAVLEALGPRGYLVNIGRGTIVDEVALIVALQAGKLAGAGLDVFAREPAVPEALRSMPNVVLTPHLGGVSDRAYSGVDQQLLENLASFFEGRPLTNLV
jgi:lactate dehydrogenase-like 2-hydroxyacid dehydrogenase